MKGIGEMLLVLIGLKCCSPSETYQRTLELCNSTNRSFPESRVNAVGEGLSIERPAYLSHKVVRHLVASGKVSFVDDEQEPGSNTYFSSYVDGEHPDLKGKFARVELVDSDPISCAGTKNSYDRYEMYLDGMRPDQCMQVTLHEAHGGKYLFSSAGKKNGPGQIIEYSLSDRLAGKQLLKVVSAWSSWPTGQFPIFDFSPSTSCVANVDSLGKVFVAPLVKEPDPHVPAVVTVNSTDPVGEIRFNSIDVNYKDFYREVEVYEPRDLVVANSKNRTILLDANGFLAHLDFSFATHVKVMALDGGILVFEWHPEGYVVSFFDIENHVLRRYKAVVGDSSLRLEGPPGAYYAYVRGSRLIMEGTVTGSDGRPDRGAGRFFEADLSEFQSMLKRK